MKINKQLKQVVNMALDDSFVKGKLNEKNAQKVIKLFKAQPRSEAIALLTNYLRGIKQRLERVTMVVESPTSLSTSEMNKIKTKFGSQFSILNSQFNLNPSLLGGLRVKIGDYIFEDSIKSRINQVKEAVLSS